MERNAGDAKVGEANAIAREHDEVVGLDVAVDDPLAMGVTHRGEHLVGVVERELRREPALQAVVEALFAERRDDDELAIDVVGVLERQDVGVVEPGDESDFLAELFECLGVQQVRVGHFEGNANALDGVARLVHHRETAFGDLALDDVLTKSLASAKHTGEKAEV